MIPFLSTVMKNNLPFQAVDIDDQNGFRAAVYAVNALYKRCGMECTDLKTARKSVSKIVKKASPENISLLLRDWYSISVDQSELLAILSELPEHISNDDETRYGKGSLVNGIEWSALSTIFRCTIAVKIVAGESNRHSGQDRSNVEWKVAVPSPNVFGMSIKTIAGPATACVFLLSHQSQTRKYYPLLPSNQFVFEPGKPLVLNQDDLISSQGSSQEASQGDAKDPSLKSMSKSSDLISQKRMNEKKKKVQFFDDMAMRNVDADTKQSSQQGNTSSKPERYIQTRKRLNSNLSTLTSRGSHSSSASPGLPKDKDFLIRSEIYEKIKNANKEKVSEVSESSIFLSTVYREARRNEREISCIEIYDRVYHSEV